MRRRLLGSRRFSLADQQRFAALSRDFNPLHVDPVAARRTMFGEPVVHGMHAVVWMLERYLGLPRRRGAAPASIGSLAVTFSKPIFLEERLTSVVVLLCGAADAQVGAIELWHNDPRISSDLTLADGYYADSPPALEELTRDSWLPSGSHAIATLARSQRRRAVARAGDAVAARARRPLRRPGARI